MTQQDNDQPPPGTVRNWQIAVFSDKSLAEAFMDDCEKKKQKHVTLGINDKGEYTVRWIERERPYIAIDDLPADDPRLKRRGGRGGSGGHQL